MKTLEIAQAKAPTVTPEEAEAAAQGVEIMHNLRLVGHMADEALTQMCMRNEAARAAMEQAPVDRIIAPSATAAAKLLNRSGGKGILTPDDVKGEGPNKSAMLRNAADQFDLKAKVCMQNVLVHAERLANALGYTMTIKPMEPKG
jgi:hypothetical protein